MRIKFILPLTFVILGSFATVSNGDAPVIDIEQSQNASNASAAINSSTTNAGEVTLPSSEGANAPKDIPVSESNSPEVSLTPNTLRNTTNYCLTKTSLHRRTGAFSESTLVAHYFRNNKIIIFACGKRISQQQKLERKMEKCAIL